MSKPNYRKIYAMKAEREGRIKAICPDIPRESGIYVFYRIDDVGLKRCYCGQAVNLLERCASHLGEYNHLGLSLKKHGFYSEKNPEGWHLIYKCCPKEKLDENEKLTIRAYADKGYQLYNVSLGGQGINRDSGQICEKKPSKGYRDGILQGKKALSRDLSYIADKYLIIDLKDEYKGKKVPERQFEKFKELMNEDSYKESGEE